MQFPTATLTAFALAAAALVSAAPAPVSQPAPSQDWKRAPHPVDTTGYTPIGVRNRICLSIFTHELWS